MTFTFIHKARLVLKRSFISALASILISNMLVFPASAASVSDRIIRVGLFYEDTALAAANLANEVGSGYRFGYFTSDQQFYEVGRTDEGSLTMLKDSNYYLSGGTYYESPPGAAYEAVGAYHIQLSGTYNTYNDAKSAASAISGAFPAYAGGTYYVRVGSFLSQQDAAAMLGGYPGGAVVGGSETSVTVTAMQTSRILFEYDSLGASNLGIMPSLGEVAKPQTWFKGYKYYGGFEYVRKAGSNLTVINYVNIDDYVQGVIPYEINASWHMETLKAQAICARTFAARNTKHSSLGFDVCNTTNCQVYLGVYTGTDYQRVIQAVQDTTGQCIYYNGQLIDSVYHSSDGGATEDAGTTWQNEVPYLKGKADPYEQIGNSSQKDWVYEYTLSDFTALLRSKGVSCADIMDAYVGSFTASGNVQTIVFVDSNKVEYTYWGDEARRFFEDTANGKYFSRRFTIVRPGESYGSGQPAAAVELYINNSSTKQSASGLYAVTSGGTEQITSAVSVITSEGTSTLSSAAATGGGNVNNTGRYIITGSGWGHNVGMSQWGAKSMADMGYTYQQIIQFYYTDVIIQ